MIIFNEIIRRHVQRCADAVEIIEAMLQGTVGDGFGEIILVESQAQVPFAERGGGVAVLPEQFSHGEAAGRDERLAFAPQNTRLQPRTPVVPARENAVTRGSADGGTGMAVGEDHALGAQAVHVGRGNLAAAGIQGMDVTVSQIIEKNV